MTHKNQRNIDYINETGILLDSVKDDGIINLPLIKSQFVTEGLTWNNVTIKVMKLYYDLYNSLEVIEYDNRKEVTQNILSVLNDLAQTAEYQYFENATLNIFRDIRDDISVANLFGIITNEEATELKEWTNNEIKETTCIKDNPLENMRYLNLEFSYHNHYMRLDGVHYNGLTNDTIINRILDKLYENDTSSAQIIKAELEERGFYSRRVANILSDGTMIELYLEFESLDGCGKVKFVRSGGETNVTTCYNLQDGYDASPDEELKDPVVERCMHELFNIMKIVEAL